MDFFTFDAHRGKLILDEARPDSRFLLIVGAQFKQHRSEFITDRLTDHRFEPLCYNYKVCYQQYLEKGLFQSILPVNISPEAEGKLSTNPSLMLLFPGIFIKSKLRPRCTNRFCKKSAKCLSKNAAVIFSWLSKVSLFSTIDSLMS